MPAPEYFLLFKKLSDFTALCVCCRFDEGVTLHAITYQIFQHIRKRNERPVAAGPLRLRHPHQAPADPAEQRLLPVAPRPPPAQLLGHLRRQPPLLRLHPPPSVPREPSPDRGRGELQGEGRRGVEEHTRDAQLHFVDGEWWVWAKDRFCAISEIVLTETWTFNIFLI